MPTKTFLHSHLTSVIIQTTVNAANYSVNFSPGTPTQAAPFFGRADVALYVTVGLNPAPGEFQSGRWPSTPLLPADHLDRLLEYFTNPLVRYYASWFDPWDDALKHIGHSYLSDTADTAHFDLSPRATIPVSNCPDRRVFVQMVDADIGQFFALLKESSKIRGLLAAGSSWGITRKNTVGAVYLDRIIRDAAPLYGFQLGNSRVFQKSGPRIALHDLTGPSGETIPLFFCGASPSARSPGDLAAAVKGCMALLKTAGF